MQRDRMGFRSRILFGRDMGYGGQSVVTKGFRSRILFGRDSGPESYSGGIRDSGGAKYYIQKYIITFFVLLYIPLTPCQAQDTQFVYNFIKYDADTISNANTLDSLFAKLLRIENGSGEVVNIFHIGDSHIQGDFFSGECRYLMQQKFGNAGRGMVFPYKAAKTSGPQDYRTSFGGVWQTNKAILPIKENTNGISGFSISTKQNGAYVLFDMKGCDSVNTYLTQTLLIPKDNHGYQYKLNIKDWTNDQLYKVNYTDDDKLPYHIVQFDKPTCKWGLEFEGSGQDQFVLHGVVALNKQSGILYHNIGVNGIQAHQYCNNPDVFTQTFSLKPDLIIISLGTNEAQDYKKTNEEFARQLDSLVMTKAQCEGVPFLITTPMESYKWGRPNPHVARVAEAWKTVAANRRLPLWDLYNIAGGPYSSYQWALKGLFSRDKVHNSIKGYALQGDLLYQALMYHYQLYVIRPR